MFVFKNNILEIQKKILSLKCNYKYDFPPSKIYLHTLEINQIMFIEETFEILHFAIWTF